MHVHRVPKGLHIGVTTRSSTTKSLTPQKEKKVKQRQSNFPWRRVRRHVFRGMTAGCRQLAPGACPSAILNGTTGKQNVGLSAILNEAWPA